MQDAGRGLQTQRIGVVAGDIRGVHDNRARGFVQERGGGNRRELGDGFQKGVGELNGGFIVLPPQYMESGANGGNEVASPLLTARTKRRGVITASPNPGVCGRVTG